jgi:phosphatidylglycerophosphate synthase
MIDQPFRSWLSGRVNLLLSIYQRAGLSPNAVTILGLIFGVFAAFATAIQSNYLAIILWWLGRIFDGTDGIYARSINRTSNFGGYLDIVADMLAYSLMIIGFAFAKPELGILWSLVLVGYVLCITSALSLGSLERRQGIGNQDNRSLKLAAGLAEGGETGICYTLLLLLPDYSLTIGWIWLMILASTVVARSLIAKRELLDPPV